jgi:hypothetical protein
MTRPRRRRNHDHRLTIQPAGLGFRAIISRREDGSEGAIGQPEVFLVDNKEAAKKRAKELARSLGLKTYRVVDKSRVV